MGHPPDSFSFIFVFSSKYYNLTTNRYVKNVHPVYSAGIWTHDLWNMSLLPWPQDQGYKTFFSLKANPSLVIRFIFVLFRRINYKNTNLYRDSNLYHIKLPLGHHQVIKEPPRGLLVVLELWSNFCLVNKYAYKYLFMYMYRICNKYPYE